MDPSRFDRIAKLVASSSSRRQALRLLGAGTAGAWAGFAGSARGADATDDDREQPGRSRPEKPGRVTICHWTGSPRNPWRRLAVAEQAVPAHEAHGDRIAPDCATDIDHCGDCGNSCDDGDPCTTDQCIAGRCWHEPIACIAIDECHDPGDCDPATGQCSTPAAPDNTPCSVGRCCNAVCMPSDSANCGSCGNDCEANALPNTLPACVEETCQYPCADGWSDCDGDPTTGCETPLGTDDHCGACDDACSDGATCQDGLCACAAGTTNCGGSCVDTSTSPDHCGACHAICQPTPCVDAVCLDGQCEWTPIDGCCATNDDCDDGNPCTTDVCNLESNTCERTALDGEEPCTIDEANGVCRGGVCVSDQAIACPICGTCRLFAEDPSGETTYAELVCSDSCAASTLCAQATLDANHQTLHEHLTQHGWVRSLAESDSLSLIVSNSVNGIRSGVGTVYSNPSIANQVALLMYQGHSADSAVFVGQDGFPIYALVIASDGSIERFDQPIQLASRSSTDQPSVLADSSSLITNAKVRPLGMTSVAGGESQWSTVHSSFQFDPFGSCADCQVACSVGLGLGCFVAGSITAGPAAGLAVAGVCAVFGSGIACDPVCEGVCRCRTFCGPGTFCDFTGGGYECRPCATQCNGLCDLCENGICDSSRELCGNSGHQAYCTIDQQCCPNDRTGGSCFPKSASCCSPSRGVSGCLLGTTCCIIDDDFGTCCSEGRDCCDPTGCVVTSRDNSHCGACGNRCMSPKSCQNGACLCTPGFVCTE